MDHIKKRPSAIEPIPGGLDVDVILPEPNLIEKMSPWTMNFRQIEPGPMQTHIRVRDGQILTLLEISMDRAVHQQGVAPPKTLTFGVSLARSDMRWRDAEVHRQGFLTFGNSDGFEGISDSVFHGVTFSVSNAEIDALADRLGMPIDDTIRSSGFFNSSRDANSTQPLAELALNYLRPTGGIAMDLGDEEEVLAHFLQVTSIASQRNERSTGKQRARAVRLALEVMEANTEENIQISRICEASGVSLRTLNRAFREVFGIGPKAYFLRMRLGLLRRALLETEPPRLVSDLANPLGFWHMGQLARDYRANFGELPSETRS